MKIITNKSKDSEGNEKEEVVAVESDCEFGL